MVKQIKTTMNKELDDEIENWFELLRGFSIKNKYGRTRHSKLLKSILENKRKELGNEFVGRVANGD